MCSQWLKDHLPSIWHFTRNFDQNVLKVNKCQQYITKHFASVYTWNGPVCLCETAYKGARLLPTCWIKKYLLGKALRGHCAELFLAGKWMVDASSGMSHDSSLSFSGTIHIAKGDHNSATQWMVQTIPKKTNEYNTSGSEINDRQCQNHELSNKYQVWLQKHTSVNS